ncbi:STAS domain-containing protein [Bacillus sp. ISL-47]|uniref:STAS domain-containing protein n=1 Tax=Bacillus sp. ISL-47 TaxID=2819130 RepID=UPI001BECF2B6|nr:STAS domain-containing protein [Bacillus sp. ISL-47]MBT2690208.1 STAS domain-containing protein [Bacillus sp. ISL-47]MBT2710343.1 STAS domain-containing protein [Pseudomonas sp. ISL-84]
MHRNKDLYQFLLEKTRQLTEEWYKNLEKGDNAGIYSSNDPAIIESVKQQNYEFHQKFCEVFNKDEESFFNDFEKWIVKVAQDEGHLSTPLQSILREFFTTQEQYLNLIDEFTETNKGQFDCSQVTTWRRIVVKSFSEVVTWFTEEYNNHSQKRLEAQQDLIRELSSPVISLTQDIALLPLVGDIDTARAKSMLENTLQQCNKLGVNQLFMDLSGVVMIDTMVAHQLFQLIEALSLIGVKTTISGLRPEIAQTAVQLGLSFDHVSIKSTLSSSIKSASLIPG